MGGVEALTQALSCGGEILWDPPDRPKIVAPRAAIEQIRGDIQAVREVLRRAVIFRKQLTKSGPIPLLVIPNRKSSDEGCISCGEDLNSGHFRCPLCQAAAWIALGITPNLKVMPSG